MVRTVLILSFAFVTASCGATRRRGDSPSSPPRTSTAHRRQIGGGHIAVTSILTDPNADPHLFEPGTSNGLAVANAKVVIQNGLGYDAFIDRLEHASPQPKRHVIVVARRARRPRPRCQPAPLVRRAEHPHVLSGDRGRPGTCRPRARLDLPRRAAPVRREPRPARQGGCEASPRLRRAAGRVHRACAGLPARSCGARNLAPVAFTRAIEDGSEPPPAAVAEMLHLFSAHEVRCSSTTTRPSRRSPSAYGRRPVPPASPWSACHETLPPYRSFQSWQLAQARALDAALSRRAT